MGIVRDNLKRGACLGVSALMCLTLVGPAYAAPSKDVSSRSETVKVDMAADGSVDEANVETLVKYSDGESETVSEAATGELPVKVEVTYSLDGKALSADEIAGKSGDIVIRYDYENTSQASSSDGSGSAFTPFTAVTAVMLDDDFTDIAVENGRVIDDEDASIVVGMAFPGLKESLGDLASDADVPEFFEIRAHVEDFELKTALTIVSAGLFSEIDTDDLDMGELGDVPEALSAAMAQLIEGSSALTSGLETLSAAGGSLHEGASTMSEGTSAFAQGAKGASDASSTLTSGVTGLNVGLSLLLNGDGTTANPGLSGIASSLSALNTKLSSYRTPSAGGQSSESIEPQLASLRSTLELIAQESEDEQSREAATQALEDLAAVESYARDDSENLEAQSADQDLKYAADTVNLLSTGLNAQLEGFKKLETNGKALESGAKQLEGGLSTLEQQSGNLARGATALEEGSGQLASGIQSAAEGSQQLTQGLETFNNEGIASINDAITNRYGALLNRMKELVQAAKDYKSFQGSAGDVESDVKFVYESAPISKEF